MTRRQRLGFDFVQFHVRRERAFLGTARLDQEMIELVIAYGYHHTVCDLEVLEQDLAIAAG